MSIDFRAQNIQTEKLIVTGDPDAPEQRVPLVIYPIQAQGTSPNQGDIGDTGLLEAIQGADVFMYVSGAVGGKGGSSNGITVFGGDLHISGNLSIDGTGGGSSGGGGTSYHSVTQTAHGFTLTSQIPIPICWNGGTSTWVVANQTPAERTKQAFVVDVVDVNAFVVQMHGYHSLTPGHGLVNGDYYWLSSSSPYYTTTPNPTGTIQCLWVVEGNRLQLLNQAPYAITENNFIPIMDPSPTENTVMTADGSGGLKDSGVLITAAPNLHASTHATGGTDPIAPADIGAATTSSVATVSAIATDALYPLVQSAHTTSTRILAAGDAGDIIPLSAASNAIVVTIPHGLWEVGGTGRAFVCALLATSISGGAITFAGSGGIVITYHGKNPGTSAVAVGDMVYVSVISATSAHVFISAVAT